MDSTYDPMRLERALAVVHRIPDSEQRIYQLVQFADLVQETVPARARELLQQALLLVNRIESAASRIQALAGIARSALVFDAAFGRHVFDRALTILRMVDRSDERQLGLNALLGTAHPDQPESLQLLELLVIEARRITGHGRRAHQLLALAEMTVAHAPELANELAAEVETLADGVDDDYERSGLLSRLAWFLHPPQTA